MTTLTINKPMMDLIIDIHYLNYEQTGLIRRLYFLNDLTESSVRDSALSNCVSISQKLEALRRFAETEVEDANKEVNYD